MLGDPMFYDKKAWVGLYFDRGGGLGAAGDGDVFMVGGGNKNALQGIHAINNGGSSRTGSSNQAHQEASRSVFVDGDLLGTIREARGEEG